MKTLQAQLENFQEKDLKNISQKWIKFDQVMKEKCSSSEYKNWISVLKFIKEDNNLLEISVPNIFVEEHVKKCYEKEIKEIFTNMNVVFKIAPTKPLVKGISFKEPNENGFFSKIGLKYKSDTFLQKCNTQIIHPDLIKWGYEWAVKPCSIFIHGGIGCGKTFFSISLIREAFKERKIFDAEYFVGTSLDSEGLEAIKSEYGDRKFLDKIKNIEFLFIDDFGRETRSDRLSRQYFEIINHRYSNEMPTIITSNLDLNGIANKIDSSIASRIQEWEVIHMTGSDARRFV